MAEAAPNTPSVKKAKKQSRLTRLQKVLLAVAIVLAVALAVVAGYKSLFVRPDLSGGGPGQEQSEIDYGDGTRPKADGERKSKDYYTVLILGRDTGGGGNTDTILLASYDVTNQKAAVMSIPRDTMVNIPYDIKRINAVYNYGGGGEKGIQSLYKEISQLVGFEPDYQVIVEWEAVGQIVDAMGGVWFDVPRDMNYEDPYQDLSIHQTQGYRLLTGDDAMQVLRYRHDNRVNGVMKGYADGDLGRIRTQQALLKAMVSQLLKLENLTKVNQFAKVFQENVETDLSFQNILWFAKSAYLGGLSVDNVSFVTMPNKAVTAWSRSYKNNQSYVVPIAGELLELVNSELSPFVEPSTLNDLDIMSVNADGSLSSTTGYVEDSKAASAPVKTDPAEPPVVDEDGNLLTDPETGGTIVVDPETGTPATGGESAEDPAGNNTSTPGTTSPGTTDPGASTPEPSDPGTTDPGASAPGPTTPEPAPPELPAEETPEFIIIEPQPAA